MSDGFRGFRLLIERCVFELGFLKEQLAIIEYVGSVN